MILRSQWQSFCIVAGCLDSCRELLWHWQGMARVMQDDICYVWSCPCLELVVSNRFFLVTGGPGMLVAVMCGMLLPFAVLHYLDYISLTWRVGKPRQISEDHCQFSDAIKHVPRRGITSAAAFSAGAKAFTL